MESLKPILAEHPFFKELDTHHLDLLVGCASNVRFDAGQFVFREGDEANAFYIVRQGKVALEIFNAATGPITIETIEQGDVLGWSWLVPPHYWRFDARALELTRAIALDGKCLRSKCEEDHHLGYHLLKCFSNLLMQRLEAARLQLMDLYDAREPHDKVP